MTHVSARVQRMELFDTIDLVVHIVLVVSSTITAICTYKLYKKARKKEG